MNKKRFKPFPLAVSLTGIVFFALLYQGFFASQRDHPPMKNTLSKLTPGNIDKESEREDEPEEAAEFFQMKRSPDGHSPVPVERYFKAVEHAKAMPQYSLATQTA